MNKGRQGASAHDGAYGTGWGSLMGCATSVGYREKRRENKTTREQKTVLDSLKGGS